MAVLNSGELQGTTWSSARGQGGLDKPLRVAGFAWPATHCSYIRGGRGAQLRAFPQFLPVPLSFCGHSVASSERRREKVRLG